MKRPSSPRKRRKLSLSSTLAAHVSALAAAVALATTSAHAANAPACIAQHEQAGDLREAGKLLQARSLLSQCTADTACPDIVRESCTSEAAELSRVIPSITLSATLDGRDVVDARVALDGAEQMTRVNGRAIELDPGEHEATFELPDGRTQKLPFVVSEGQRLRAVTAQFHTQTPAEKGAAVSPAPTAPASSARTAATYALGGLAVAGFSAFGFFALRGKSQEGDLDRCKPICPRADYDRMKTSYLTADVGLGVGVVASAGAVYLLLSGPGSSEAPAKTARTPTLSFAAAPSGMFATVGGSY